MIVFPNAKINLGLNITEKRPDGYHNLETIFYPVQWEDALEVVPSSSGKKTGYTFHPSGNIIPGNTQDNLVIKAYQLLNRQFGLPAVDIYLYKNIPTGAGLGGGSSDAAYMLTLLNNLFNLELTTYQLEEFAATLGADCPFFIHNKPLFAQGTGNIFSPVALSLAGYQIVVIKPDVFVSTRDAFAHIIPRNPQHTITGIIQLPPAEWKEYLVNDFEESVFVRYPEIRKIKNTFYKHGAIYASMSGSGSAVYGIFEPGFQLPNLKADYPVCFQGEFK